MSVIDWAIGYRLKRGGNMIKPTKACVYKKIEIKGYNGETMGICYVTDCSSIMDNEKEPITDSDEFDDDYQGQEEEIYWIEDEED